MSTFYKIGEIAALYGISTDILRYYEELGILVPRRAPNGYRVYRTEDLWCLNVIRDLRELGFSMDQILAASAPDIPALLLDLAWYLFLVGPAEELVFRGYLFHALSEVTRSPGLACALASLLFGAMHLRGGDLLRLCSTALLGLIFTLPLLRGKRAISTSISAHSIHNAVLELLRWSFC